MKKVISVLLCIAVALTFSVYTPEKAYAASGSETKSTKGVYWFDPHEVGIDLTDTYIYNDELLKGDSLKFNKKLATMSYELAIASISSEREPRTAAGYKNKSRNLRAYLEDNGFVDFETNRYYKEKMTTTTMGAACAHKKIVDNGKTYTLLAIVPRSAGYEAEWGGNFVMGAEGDHAGFKNGREIVLAHAKQYVKKYGIKGNIKVWTAGYSRGAGVTNQVGAALLAQPKKVLGDSINLTRGNVYCYTFGTPNSAASPAGDFGDPKSDKFKYIHNLWESYDIVTAAPPVKFGFDRYGTSTGYAVPANKARMLKFLKQTNSAVYDLYMDGGDPDKFSPKTIDVEKLITERKIALKDDPDPYLPSDQREFMEMMSDSLSEAVDNSRQKYNDDYQEALQVFCGYLFSHLGDAGKLVEGIRGSKFTPAMVAFMYISYMTDRYSTTEFGTDEEKAEIRKAVDMLKEIIEEKKAAGEELPENLEEYVTELERALATADFWGAIKDLSWGITAILYIQVMEAGLENAQADQETIDKITSGKAGKAMTRLLSFLLLYDNKQTDRIISFEQVYQQMKHMATLIGNASSFMRPHNNEIILSWLRAQDPTYDDVKKENAAQIKGYRRVFIEKSNNATLTGTITNGGKTVAKIRNGKLISRSDKWIGLTTCDKGNWLRLPLNKTYRIKMKTTKDTKLTLKVKEYSVYDGKTVRTVTKDSKYKWTKLAVDKKENVTLVVNAVKKGSKGYTLPSKAKYYIIKKVPLSTRPVLLAKAKCKGKTAATISWNKIKNAKRYVLYFSKCDKTKKTAKYKTLGASKLSYTVKGLKKEIAYKFYVVAQRKKNGKFVNIATAYTGHFVTGNFGEVNRTNPKALKLAKTKITLKEGKTYKVKATVTKVMEDMKLLTKGHAAKLRYRTNDKTTATVSAGGKIKAVGKGVCRIYVQAVNGISASVKVTVK
ncbi:MAG: hypothetical protein IKE49_03375 [Firmicutes bacterium]|nr:hypothetical protein [Bacillota bacterium]